jgi:two-component system sensor histidine kinase AlgZ
MTRRALASVAVMIPLAALAATVLYGWFAQRFELHELTRIFAVSLIYSLCMGVPASLVTPFVMERTASRPLAVRLFLLSAGLLAGVTVGCLAATPILVYTRISPGAWVVFGLVLRLSMVLVLAMGFIAFFFTTVLQRLADTTVRLRRKELDEERARTLLAEARLSTLQSRVNPHFLFNALNSIASLIPEDPALAEKLVGRLASLLRLSLESEPRSLLALSEELRITRGYLEIEAARYGGRLHYSFDLPDGLESVEVPLLSVQCLVENSVRHAIASAPDGGSVAVSARAEGGDLLIEVADSGAGFSLDGVAPGHAVDNLMRRLDALFGPAAALGTSLEGGRFAVRFRVPQSR